MIETVSINGVTTHTVGTIAGGIVFTYAFTPENAQESLALITELASSHTTPFTYKHAAELQSVIYKTMRKRKATR